MKLNVLLVNDDGIHAPGLKHLWESLKDKANVTIVAPSTERSGAGLSISMYHPLHLHQVPWPEETPAYSLSGTPADCVKIALSEVVKTPPDLILSGINKGTNAGRNAFYSGTVGGAMEGALRGIPGIALSCCESIDPDYEGAAIHVPSLIDYVKEHPLPHATILNVNFPSKELGPIKGMRLARQGKNFFKETPERRRHPEGTFYYWLGGKHTSFDEHEHSDIHYLNQGYAAAVPLKIAELTHEELFDNHTDIFASFFSSQPQPL